MRIIKAGMALFLLLCMVLVVGSVFFLDQGAVFLLRQTGAYGIHCNGLRIGSDSVTVSDFRASFVLPNGDRLSLETKDAVFLYDIRQLLQEGKGQSANFAELSLTLKKEIRSNSLPMQFPDTMVLLREELRNRLPLSALHITKIRLLGDFPKLLLEKDLQLDAGIKSGELQIALLAKLKSKGVVALRMRSPDPGHATAGILVTGEGEQLLRGELQLTPDSLSGKMAVTLEELREILVLAGRDPILPDMEAKVSLKIEYPLGTTSVKSIVTTVAVTDIESSILTCSSAVLHLIAVPVSDGVDLGRKSRLVLMGLRGDGFQFEKLSIDLGGELRYQQGQGVVRFGDGQKIVAHNMFVSGMEIKDVELGFGDPLHGVFEGNIWSVADNSLLLAPLTIIHGESLLESDSLRCEFSGMSSGFPDPGLTVTFKSPRLAYSDQDWKMSVVDLNGVVQLVEQRLEGQIQFIPEIFGGMVQIQLHHLLSSAKGSFSLETPTALEFNEPEAMLSSLRKRWHYPFDLESGKLSLKLQGEYYLSQKTEMRLQVDLREGRGFARQFLFNGLSLKQKFRIYSDLKLKGSGSIVLDHLVGGLDTYDIKADTVVEMGGGGKNPLLEVNNFRASLLEGSVTSSPIRYDFNMPKSGFNVKIEGMSLVSLVDLLKMENLRVTGVMGGTIPVRVDGREVSVSGAELHSEGAGGEIHYTPGMMGQTGVTGYALKAVENLQYDKLTVSADYAASGQLDLLIGIHGRSPELSTTRPVQLNINAEQNLPALLKSLRFSKGLTDELDKRVKRHYN